MPHREFWEAGFRIFGLHGVTPGGQCKCGHEDCKAVLKHPISSNWQHTPVWSEEQIEAAEMAGMFDTGYGILCRELLIVDIDARNGGLPTFTKLAEVVPEISGAGMIVNTGSGGGSRHLYFRVPEGMSLLTKHPDYPGIDFKSGNAYVVGPGSLHSSGSRYEIALGGPDDIDMAPQSLLDLIKRPERYRADLNGIDVDVSMADLADMLSYITDADDYEMWVRIGMALHHASGGTAIELWDKWSQQSSKYDAGIIGAKWHSFGKSSNPVTLGTLVHHAESRGWKWPVTFSTEGQFDFLESVVGSSSEDVTIDTSGVDLLRPPGFAGELAKWVESRCRHPRENLSSMAALTIISNICGLRYTDDRDGVSANLIVFNVAGSGTGKEAVQQSIAYTHRVCGMAECTYGAIKSEQEIVRNLVRHQPAFYLVDEIGSFLTKIQNAQKRGSASYLEGVIAIIMSAFSKANAFIPISGDMKEDVRSALKKQLAQIEKHIEEDGDSAPMQAILNGLTRQLEGIRNGIEKPYVTISGFTTNVDFGRLMDYDNAMNGFMGRALLCIEHETTPKSKKRFKPGVMSPEMEQTLVQLSTGGSFDVFDTVHRIEHYGHKVSIPTTDEANAMLDKIIDVFEDMAERHKGDTGLEAMPMRAYEQVAKVSLILAIPEGLRTAEHVRWAYKLVLRDIEQKMMAVMANDRAKDEPATALMSKIGTIIGGEDGERLGVIVNRCRGYKREDVEACLAKMEDRGMVSVETAMHKYRKIEVKRYKLTK